VVLRCFAPSKNRCKVQTDTRDEGIGMPMCQPPLGPFAPIDQSDAQGPILGWQTADLAVAAFDNHENYDATGPTVGVHFMTTQPAIREQCPREGGSYGSVPENRSCRQSSPVPPPDHIMAAFAVLTVGGFVWKRQRRGGNRETARSARLNSPAHGPSSR
jgi:hypothetical protein